jgi:hypothetical protein
MRNGGIEDEIGKMGQKPVVTNRTRYAQLIFPEFVSQNKQLSYNYERTFCHNKHIPIK